jgi:formylglycine-generating enzyme required for sulfatase activity
MVPPEEEVMKNALLPSLLLIFLLGCGPSPSAPSGEPKTTTARAHEEPVELVTASGIEMIALPGGEFSMGSNQGNPDEAPAHLVKLTAFAIDKYEVTQEMLEKVQLPNPSHWHDHPKKPVERARWIDAKQYCNERSMAEGLTPCYNEKTPDWRCDFNATGYRLPTEAEWEYACKAGGTSVYDFGQVDKLRQFSWFADNGDQKTHPVGQKKANRWGIHDLYGNVSEWCEDVYSPDYYKASPAQDPVGPDDGGKDPQRVMRGGSWKSTPEMCRATFRTGQKTGNTDACFFTDYCGFRCVRRIAPAELAKLQTK